mgnify:CR=1 FL=1
MKAITLAKTAERLSCSVDTVRGLIRSGRLHAVNLTPGSQRPKLVVPERSLEEFLAPPKAAAKPGRRSSQKTAFKRY